MNSRTSEAVTLAIVGAGPSGLSALENVCIALSGKRQIREHAVESQVDSSGDFCLHITLFEASRFPGSGPNYAPEQSGINWLNIPDRSIDIPARPPLFFKQGALSAFPSYQQWRGAIDQDADAPDHYPTRADIGRYLQERFQSLADPLIGWGALDLIQEEVVALHVDSPAGRHRHTIRIEHSGGGSVEADEVCLALGHQPACPDDTLTHWQAHAREHRPCHVLDSPYPTDKVTDHEHIGTDTHVAIRGFGLSMIDIVKAMTEDRGGRFAADSENANRLRYLPSGREPALILPFSLDGLPLAPKPLNESIDNRFKPDDTVREACRRVCEHIADLPPEQNPCQQLMLFMASAHAEHFVRAGRQVRQHGCRVEELIDLGMQWLKDELEQHELIVDKSQAAGTSIGQFIDMACGQTPASLDYSMGQFWHHLQDTLHHGLSFSRLADRDLLDIEALDTRMKRYAYGPPVASMQRLLALHDCGLLRFSIVDDPDIRLSEAGWQLLADGHDYLATVMIDSVLAPPDISIMDSPLVRQLLTDNLIRQRADSLGAVILEDGRAVAPNAVCRQNGEPESSDTDPQRTIRTRSDFGNRSPGKADVVLPISIVGRMAKGSLLGTDSLPECFGSRTRVWASELVRRLPL